MGKDYAYRAGGRLDQDDEQPIRVLLVEDRRGALDGLAGYLRAHAGMRIDGISDSGLLAGVRAIFDTPDAVLISADLGGFTAWDTVRLIKQLTPNVAVLVIGRARPQWWVRPAECPDAIVEQPEDHATVLALIRGLRAQRLAAGCAAMQVRSGGEQANRC
jgi:DNA-binding NarL/FixJ family response regulator